MKSVAFDVTALTKALNEAVGFITDLVFAESGLKPIEPMKWVAHNGMQNMLVRKYQAVSADLKNLPELQAWAKKTAEELNKILEEHHFSIRLDPWQESRDRFGVVAIYDITIEWLVTGQTDIPNTHDKYWLPVSNKPAFRLAADDAQLQFFRIDGNVVLKIPGKVKGDFLCLTIADRPLEDFELLGKAERLRARMARAVQIDDFAGAVLPNIVFDTGTEGIDISWLVGLETTDAFGGSWEVIQAKMQAKFAMGPKGARARVAVAIGMRFLSIVMEPPKRDYIADHDLVIWMERDGVSSEPFFVTYVPKDEFADHTVGLDEID